MLYTNETLSVIIYMCNTWSQCESLEIFGGAHEYDLGYHIWNQYEEMCENYGTYGAIPMFIAYLDTENYQKLVDRACSKYNGRNYR